MGAPADDDRYRAPALDKGLDILERLAVTEEGLSQAELAKALSRSPNEIYRMLDRLVRRGYVLRTSADRYELSLKMFELAHAHPPVQRLVSQALPVMRRFSRAAGQSCHLVIRDRNVLIVAAQVESPNYWGVSIRVGSRMGLLDTGSGHVFLAYASPEELSFMLEAEGDSPAEKLDPTMRARLDAVRARAYENMPSLQTRGVVNLSVPVSGPAGSVIAVLTTPFTERLDKTDVADEAAVLKLLIAAGAEIFDARRRRLTTRLREEPMAIIDTHLHLIYPDRFSYPWLAGAPAINKPWSIGSYFAEAEKLGIEAALHMEVDVAEEDIEGETRFVTTLDPRLVGAIAGARPESPDFPMWLEKLGTIGGVKAVRRILHQAPDDLSKPPLFAANLRRLAAYGLAFDLCIRDDQILEIGIPLVKQCPHVQFVLDHCGNPDIAGAGLDPWRGHITEIAKLPNIVCKVSGIIAYGGPNPTAAMLRPYIEHVIESFGWERVVWGSDHPVCTLTGSLTQWVGITNEVLAGVSADERARLLRDNARRIYRLEDAA